MSTVDMQIRAVSITVEIRISLFLRAIAVKYGEGCRKRAYHMHARKHIGICVNTIYGLNHPCKKVDPFKFGRVKILTVRENSAYRYAGVVKPIIINHIYLSKAGISLMSKYSPVQIIKGYQRQ